MSTPPIDTRTAAAEEAVVGTLLAEPPDELPPFCARLLQHAPESFDDLRLGTIAAAIGRLREAGKPIGPLTVKEQLNGQLDDIGGSLFLNALLVNSVGETLLEFEATALWEAYRRRRVKSVCADAAAAMESDPAQADSIVQCVRQSLDALEGEHSNGQPLPQIHDATDFLAQTITEPRELVWGILHQGSKMVLGGGSKTFKTWTLLDLAVSVAAGETWLSFKTSKGKVLFLNFEIQPAFFQQRIQAVAQAKHIALGPHCLEVWNLRGCACSYTEILPLIRRRIKDEGYSLVVLDPVYKLYGETDENSAGQVARLMNALELVTVDTGASIAFGAHYAKGNASGKESIDRISGSGVFARDPDTILNFTRHETDDAFTVEATLRNFKPVSPFVVRWQYPLMRRADDLDPAKLKQAAGRPKVHTVERILKALAKQKLTTTAWLKRCGSEIGTPKTQFYALLEEAKKLPGLKQTRKGQWFYEAPQTDKK